MTSKADGTPWFKISAVVGFAMQPTRCTQTVITANTMTTMRIKNILYIIICLLALFPKPAKAQFGFDVVSVEAYINDHKEQRSLLLVRSTLEASNKLLHDYSSDANIDFKNINKELDKYTRAFDIIDVLYQSLRTSLNVYNTYETVSDRVSDYKKMLNDFNEKCLSRGNIVTTDTLLITRLPMKEIIYTGRSVTSCCTQQVQLPVRRATFCWF